MKKFFIAAVLLTTTIFTAMAQNKGSFDVYEFDGFKLHVYNTGDALGDASYIVEGKRGLVTIEYPLFKDNVEEFNAYISKLGKKVKNNIADYHIGGSGDIKMVMVEGMPEFMKGNVYGGMMQNFAQAFGDSMAELPEIEAKEVAFGKTIKIAGVPFTFNHGASSDFPGASIIIGGQVYYSHWAPSKSHASNLQFGSAAAVDAELEAARAALASGCTLFIGGHGGAVDKDALNFRIKYLETVKANLNLSKDAFVKAMEKAFPGLAGEEGLGALADALCK